jgi:hypothetical protein
MKTIHLTPEEAKIIDHWLEVPDCIAEVYGPENGDRWGLEDIEDVQTKVEDLIARTFADKPKGGMVITFDPADEDQLMILEEVIDGNNIAGIVQDMCDYETGEPDKIEGERLRRHMRNINKKFEANGLKGFAI